MVSDALRQYREESIAIGRSPDYEQLREGFLIAWADRFTELRSEFPYHRERNQLNKALLGTLNGLQAYKDSQAVAEDLLASSEDAISANRWHHELGEILYKQYLISGEIAEAEACIEHFSKAIELAETITDPSFLDQRAAHTLSDIRYLGWLKADALNDYATGAEAFEKGNSLLRTLTDPQQESLKTQGWTSEFWLSKKLTACAKGGMAERAGETLDRLCSLSDLRWAPGYYAYQFARYAFPEKGRPFQEFVNSWIDEKTPDTWTPALLFYVAEDLRESGGELEACSYYTRMITDYRGFLEELDQKALEEGAGGYLAGALDALARIYVGLGMDPEARVYAREFVALFPNDSRFDDMVQYLESSSLQPVLLVKDASAIHVDSVEQHDSGAQDQQAVTLLPGAPADSGEVAVDNAVKVSFDDTTNNEPNDISHTSPSYGVPGKTSVVLIVLSIFVALGLVAYRSQGQLTSGHTR